MQCSRSKLHRLTTQHHTHHSLSLSFSLSSLLPLFYFVSAYKSSFLLLFIISEQSHCVNPSLSSLFCSPSQDEPHLLNAGEPGSSLLTSLLLSLETPPPSKYLTPASKGIFTSSGPVPRRDLTKVLPTQLVLPPKFPAALYF